MTMTGFYTHATPEKLRALFSQARTVTFTTEPDLESVTDAPDDEVPEPENDVVEDVPPKENA